ncbi:hypothetical protein [Nitrosomonas ureae]|uniref:hypothetical protein n=1 Tax=Nitrosomonas ureae TaxID=44577 RepID=UPI0011AB65B6|nr:hypothetical protein [Nitrosomonas ureae]
MIKSPANDPILEFSESARNSGLEIKGNMERSITVRWRVIKKARKMDGMCFFSMEFRRDHSAHGVLAR